MKGSTRTNARECNKLRFWIISLLLFELSDGWVMPPVEHQCCVRRSLKQATISLEEAAHDVPPANQETQENWWEKENVHTISLPFTQTNKANPWQGLVPPTPWSKGVDVAVEFVDAHDGAMRISDACFASSDRAILSYMERSFREFQDLVKTMCPTLSEIRCKARIVATRGPSGTKCPRWHFDHVPVRWIQSLHGPGCEYLVGDVGIHRDALNNLDWVELPVHKVNAMMVSASEVDVRQGREGEAVLLVGKGWDDDNTNVQACIHKSPDLHSLEGRVLLTVDVLPPRSS